jgi:hypothetical protein
MRRIGRSKSRRKSRKRSKSRRKSRRRSKSRRKSRRRSKSRRIRGGVNDKHPRNYTHHSMRLRPTYGERMSEVFKNLPVEHREIIEGPVGRHLRTQRTLELKRRAVQDRWIGFYPIGSYFWSTNRISSDKIWSQLSRGNQDDITADAMAYLEWRQSLPAPGENSLFAPYVLWNFGISESVKRAWKNRVIDRIKRDPDEARNLINI